MRKGGPTRAEFERLARQIDKIAERQEAITRELEIQFQRIADVQADIDIIRSAWVKTKGETKQKRA
jgi:hypothetical protein